MSKLTPKQQVNLDAITNYLAKGLTIEVYEGTIVGYCGVRHHEIEALVKKGAIRLVEKKNTSAIRGCCQTVEIVK